MGRRISLLLTLGVLLPGCGGGGSSPTPTFAQGVIGPGGGSMAAGPVTLHLPPGALTEDTVLRILAQPYPLPIDPAAPAITPLPGFHCIGPIGQALGAPGNVRFCQDPATIPAGTDVDDLVLLEWDADDGFLRISPTATYDPATGCFTDPAYFELGHLGVGVVTGAVAGDLVFVSDPVGGAGLRPAVVPLSGLVLADSRGLADASVLPGTQGAQDYVASPDGTRVLWRSDDFDGETFTSNLLSSRVSDGEMGTLVSGSAEFLPYDPLFGFLSDSRVYATQGQSEADASHDVLREVGASGVPSPSNLYRGGSAYGYLIDVRVSPDESMVVLRFRDYSKGTFDSLFVIDAITGDEIGAFLPGVDDEADVTPRWLPDSSGLYYPAESAQSVLSVRPDGTSVTTLYTMPAIANSYIQDFVVSPSFGSVPTASVPCAYVRGSFTLSAAGVHPAGAVVPVPTTDHSFFIRDVLGGGGLAATDLGTRVYVEELAYQPGGARVLADLVDAGGQIIIGLGDRGEGGGDETIRLFDGTSAAQLRSIVSYLGRLDVDRGTDAMVLWMPTGGQDPAFPSAGLFRLAPDGSTLGPLDTGGFVPTGPARYLRSWRRVPGPGTATVR